jgi:two-component system LytT family response regulator
MTAAIRVLIADDEPAARRTIQLLLSADSDFVVLGECSDGAQALEAIVRLRPDLVFLDVQMPRCDGFGVLSQLSPDAMPLVVFVTAFDEYTLRAFDVHAADYLLKPFSDQRFRAATAHVKERVRQRSVTDVERLLACVRELGASPRRGDPTGERIAIRTADSILLLPLGDIEWVEARGDYIRIHSQGRGDLVRETIGGFEQRLPPDRFVRVHRSAIVNLGRVREVRTLPSGEQVAVLQSGVRCRLSRSGRERLGRLVALGN